jgi:superfamily II DNA or RNA helicase
MIIEITNQTRLFPLSALPGNVAARIRDRLTFPNPQWEENEKRNFSNWQTPAEIKGYRMDGDALVIPRGATRQVLQIIKAAGLPYRLEDHRRTLPGVDFTFHGQLKGFQEEAVGQMSHRDFGTLAAPTGSGKTVMALAMIARRRQPALVVCHTKELQDQWISRIETFLGIPANEIGRIGGSTNRAGDSITVALVQSLYKVATNVAGHIGHLVVDECHRAPSRTFTECVTAFDCKYQLGLSATPWRRDGLSRLIFWHLGDVAHKVDKAALVEAGHVLQADVVWRETDFKPHHDPSAEYSKMLSELTQDQARNALIASDVAKEARNGGGVCLVLSDRKAHCEALQAALEGHGIKAALLHGGPWERRKARGCGGPERRSSQGTYRNGATHR